MCTREEKHRRLARDLGAAWCGGAMEQPPAKLDAEQEKLLRDLAKLRGEEAPPGRFAPGQQGFFSRLRDAFNGR